MAYDVSEAFPAPNRGADERRHEMVWSDERRGAVAEALERAERIIRDEPDQAAWLLDGALRRLMALWFARRVLRLPEHERALALLDRLDGALAMRVRLALRAPDVAARLAHCWALLVEIDGAASDEAGASSPIQWPRGR